MEQTLSARELILALMDSVAVATLGVRYFLAAGALFEMDPGSVRVALARLVKDGTLVQARRGVYALGERTGTLNRLLRRWAHVEEQLKPWSGGWLTVHVAHLRRSHKRAVRARERALALRGFAKTSAGIWVRPENLAADLEEIRCELVSLGLDADALVAAVHDIAPAAVIAAHNLWDRGQLEKGYRIETARLKESIERLPSLTDDTAARETLELGRAVTRLILLDPLLPDALVDTRLRRRLIDTMASYDKMGKARWRSFYERHLAEQSS